MKRLCVTRDGASLVAGAIGASHQPVATSGQTRAIIAAQFLADRAVKQTKGVDTGPMGNRGIKNAARCGCDPSLFIAVELVLDVRLKLDRLIRSIGIGKGDICPNLNMFTD